ncbi:hypothetical protein BOTCAL_0125g00230 [Botryotinia calthae]|uniref:Uncharacterized protein n=1 Tax=Botryotinia calthae TaxID=38488 RepID=A0A4Y8D6E2_9HELO|nr:hypothetical protein BOTCAL_0125g00230 [Botryotinia calthae]
MQARTEGLKHYKLLEWVPETSKGKERLIKVPEQPAKTCINWEVDRIVINDFKIFWVNSWIPCSNAVADAYKNLKLHDDDRSSAYDLAQKLIDNGVKFLAVGTGNDGDNIGVFFGTVYP